MNFNTISKAAQVSKSWLYKQPEIRLKIEEIRAQKILKEDSTIKRTISASIEAKNAIIATLKQKIRTKELENVELKKQLEIIYGQFHQSKQ